jgi:hypothetical protein
MRVRATVQLVVFTALAFCICPSNKAQRPGGTLSVDEAEKKLTGGNSREWIYKHTSMKMSAPEDCSGEGEVYRFFADHHLVVDQCQNTKIVHTTRKWAIAQEGVLDIVLRIDNKPYYLLFKDMGITHSMILRERSDSKTVPTVDREFRLSND